MMGVQGAMAEEVNSRLQKATGELVDKYAAGKGGQEDQSIVDGPAGAAYKGKNLAERRAKKQWKAEKAHLVGANAQQSSEHDGDDDDDDGDGDEDNELWRIREQRLRQVNEMQNAEGNFWECWRRSRPVSWDYSRWISQRNGQLAKSCLPLLPFRICPLRSYWSSY